MVSDSIDSPASPLDHFNHGGPGVVVGPIMVGQEAAIRHLSESIPKQSEWVPSSERTWKMTIAQP